MKIAGRKEEIKTLQRILSSEHSEFVALYGRRRIGKTYLIRQVYEKNLVFECGGLHEHNLEQQLENFWSTLNEVNTVKTPRPKSWLKAFGQLKDYIISLGKKKKKVIFLDELSWFATPRSGFLAALDQFWNQFCSKRNDIILVICGSAASWIIKQVVHHRGGLHNRITETIRLLPFNLMETKQFLELYHVRWTEKDIVQLYMCTGGVPYYLQYAIPGNSVPQTIDRLFFGKQAKLIGEFSKLYAALFKNSYIHIKIVEALVKKMKGFTREEVIKSTRLKSGGALTSALSELVECGFIEYISPIYKSKEEGLYRLIDEYTAFYFKFLDGNTAMRSWIKQFNKPEYVSWSGFAFESLCLKHTHQIKKSLGIHGIETRESSWVLKGSKTQKGAQIDWLIVRDDRCINLIEVKFCNALFVINKTYENQLQHKVQIFKENTKTNKNVFVTLLTPYGVKKNAYYLSLVTNDIKLHDLFESEP